MRPVTVAFYCPACGERRANPEATLTTPDGAFRSLVNAAGPRTCDRCKADGTDEQKRENAEALAAGVDEALAREVGCAPHEDALGLLVDRELARAGLLPPEALTEMSPAHRALVLEGKTADEAGANIEAEVSEPTLEEVSAIVEDEIARNAKRERP